LPSDLDSAGLGHGRGEQARKARQTTLVCVIGGRRHVGRHGLRGGNNAGAIDSRLSSILMTTTVDRTAGRRDLVGPICRGLWVRTLNVVQRKSAKSRNGARSSASSARLKVEEYGRTLVKAAATMFEELGSTMSARSTATTSTLAPCAQGTSSEAKVGGRC